MVLYELVTSEVPFDGYTAGEVKARHVTDEPVPPTELNVNVHPGLQGVILRALSKDPSSRYDTIEQLRWDLRAVIDQMAVAAGEVTSGAQAEPSGGRRRPRRGR